MCVPASLFCRLETPRIRYTARLGWSGVHVLHAVSCLSVCRCCLDAPVHLHGGRVAKPGFARAFVVVGEQTVYQVWIVCLW